MSIEMPLYEQPNPEKGEIKQNPADDLIKTLPDLAYATVNNFLDMSKSDNKDFAQNPDSFKHHSHLWHEWGIITHTQNFLNDYRGEAHELLDKWELSGLFEKLKDSKIDGIQKSELLEISIALHDIGKFASRVKFEGEQPKYSFPKHEKLSGDIIRADFMKDILRTQYELTPNQIEYIAKCAQYHFELGLIRKAAKKTQEGYTENFPKTKEFEESATQLIKEHSEIAVEIGILFLADSLSKVNRVQRDQYEQDRKNGFTPQEFYSEDGRNITQIVAQNKTNLAVAKKYLEILNNTQ